VKIAYNGQLYWKDERSYDCSDLAVATPDDQFGDGLTVSVEDKELVLKIVNSKTRMRSVRFQISWEG
jgi:hypothetical protein